MMFQIVYTILLGLWIVLNPSLADPIVLRDDTPKGYILSKAILPNLHKSGYKMALLRSEASEYFQLNEETGQLSSAKLIDKDRLCMDSKLCCPSSKEDKFHTSRFSYHSLSNLCAHTHMSQILNPPAICTFNLSVSVVVSPRDPPDVNDITIVICEENDHVPEFKLPPGLSSSDLSQAQQMEFRAFPREQPLLIVNISESAPITSRIRLPLAEDLDSPPFNVQRYELDNSNPPGTSPDMNKAVLQMFQLNMIYDNLVLMDSNTGIASSISQSLNMVSSSSGSSSISNSDQAREGHLIVGLELLLLDKLDREKMEHYRFRILAIDGGVPSHTGTLQIQINVLDANDHAPIFSQPVYEANVPEGVIERNILQLVATDQDKGQNALVSYGWPKGSEWTEPNQTSSQEQSVELLASRPPGFWFSLNEESGILAVRHPLDYEVKSKHVFHVLAFNPISSGTGSIKSAELTHSSMTATAKVVINVINTNDEAPVIQIDYVTGDSNKTFKSITENQPSPYFIAFITAYDPDFDGDLAVAPSGHDYLGFNVQAMDSSDSVKCQLDSHSAKSYELTEVHSHRNSNPSRVRYTLSTLIPLDREKSAEDRIVITCRDSGPSPKTSTATAVVKILDENDCTPEVHVSVLSSQGTHHGRIQPWSEQKLRQWIENQEPTNTLPYSPICSAYLTNVPIFTVTIAENQPPGTVFARLKALDADAGENGRVTFEMLKTTLFLNLSDSVRSSHPKFLAFNHDQAEIASSAEAFEYFQIDPNSGDFSTRRLIDREEDYMIREQIFVFIKATDNGSQEVRSSIVLLDVIILDENDNAPFFVESKLHFSIEENLPAPAIVGEIRVIDPDLNPNRMLETDSSYIPPINSKLPYHSSSQSDSKYMGSSRLSSSFGVSHQSRNSLQLHIDPVNGRRDLPFILYRTADGRFFLNTTRALDRELEEAFQFKIIATDRDPAQIRESVGLQPMLKRQISHTATALVLISVIDVNDNNPEIIFPSPTTSNSTVHRLSYREYAGYEIVSINANDRDNEKSNGKFHFELVPDLKGADLFMIDRTSGMLRTRRRLTKDDLGEHLVQVVVRDEGDPPLETRLSLRLVVDQSEPHWQYDPRANPSGNFDSSDYLNGKQQARLGSKGSHEVYKETETLMRMHDRRIMSSDLVLFVIIAFILALILIILGICIYLRHTRNIFNFMPDLCDFCTVRVPWSTSATDSQCNRLSNEKSYVKNANGHFESTNGSANGSGGGAGLGGATYRYSNDLLSSKRQAQLKLGSLASISSPQTVHTAHNKPQSPLSNQHLDSQLHGSMNLTTSYSSYHPGDSNNFGLVDCSRPIMVNTMQFSPNMCERRSRAPNGTLYRPGTTLAVNVPDVADQAETLRKQHGSYYPFTQTIIRPNYSNERLLKAHDYQSAEGGLLHTYNVGKHRLDTDDRIYFANDFGGNSPEQHLPPNQKFWNPAADLGFRPIDERAHLYQAIPTDDPNTSDCCNQSPPILVNRPHGKVWCTPYPKPDQAFVNPVSLTRQGSQLGHWKSDPSLNQSNPDLTQIRGKLPDELLRTNYYDKIDAHHTELKKIADASLRLKRSKSSKYNTSRTANKPSAPYYSALREPVSLLGPTDQGLAKPLLATNSPVNQDVNPNSNNSHSQHNNNNSDLNNTSSVESNDSNNNRHYAVSFPTVQASFV